MANAVFELVECKLGQIGVRCPACNFAGKCTIYASGIDVRMERGECTYMNIHAPRVGIHLPKGAKKKVNPLKAAKRGG